MTSRARPWFAGLLAGLTLMLGAMPAAAVPVRAYLPDFVCAVPYAEPGGSCSVDLESGTYQLDMLMPHGFEGGVMLEVSAPDGSVYRSTCAYRNGAFYQQMSCDGMWSGPSIRLIDVGGSSGQHVAEEYVDFELLTSGRASVTVGDGNGVATLRGRRA